MNLSYKEQRTFFYCEKLKSQKKIGINMKIGITGASGFVGTNFIIQNKDIEIKEIDLLIHKLDDFDFSGLDSVLHLAALVHQMKGAPEKKYFDINYSLAIEVAKRCKEQGVKHFILMSTAKVFGESTSGREAFNENSDCNPLDPYGQSKFLAEKEILLLRDENFKVAIIRSPLVYGAGVKANMLNLIKLIDKFSILPFGSINNKRSFVFIGNLIALIRHILIKEADGIFIARDQYSYSTTQLVKMIAKALNKKVILLTIPSLCRKLLFWKVPKIYERLFGSMELNNSITNKILQFEPPYSTEQGISETIRWYKKSN